jgi:hypothetical protein
MKKTVRPSIFLTPVLALLLCSCAGVEFHGVRPVSPPIPGRNALHLPQVDSLQPTFSWTSASSPETKYDLMIFTGVWKRSGYSEVKFEMGETVYYREAIEGCSHHIEQTLKPATTYEWSVRTRNGSNVGPWSNYYDPALSGGSGTLSWSFVTPKR